MSIFFTFGETKSALKETTRDELAAIATVIATQIDGDALAALNSGDEDTSEFRKIRDQLYDIEQSNSEIMYLYTMRKLGDDIAFVVDADYGIEDDVAGINEVYDGSTPEMFEGFEQPAADSGFTTDQWGTVLSGYAPVKDSDGNVVGIVGIDMDSNRVIERQDFIGNTIYLILLVGIIISGLIVGFFSRTMMRDINSLNDSAEKISKGDMDVLVTVERNDEIGVLANSFSRMVSSLKIMMMESEDE